LNTILGKGSFFDGSLEVEGDIRIDGSLKGKIKATDILTVGSSGKVEAEVAVKCLILGGKLVGHVFASEKVELQSKSVLIGDITTKSLTIEAGAVFQGNCNMSAGEGTQSLPERYEKESPESEVRL